jgi:uncharacterized protein (TIGR04255 family)
VRRHYQNPPIVEALVEIFFTGAQRGLAVRDAFFARIRDRFPTERVLNQTGLEVNMSPGQASARLSQGEPRFQFLNPDESQMTQLAPGLLVFNQVRTNPQVPYPRFERWRPIALEMLNLYREIAQPAGVDRLGVRYINRLIIPRPSMLMEDYFTVYPQVPDTLNSRHGPFLMNMELAAPHEEHQLLFTLGSTPSEQPGTMSYLLDLYNILPLGPSDSFETLPQRLDEAHDNIVTTFEYTITDTTRTLFGEAENGDSV